MRLIVSKLWWLVLVILVGAAAGLLTQTSRLDIDADVEELFDNVDPSLEKFRQNQKIWGDDEYAIMCVTRDQWFTPEGIEEAKNIAGRLASDVRHARMIASLGDVPLLRQQEKPSLLGMIGGLKTLFTEGIDIDRARLELESHAMARDNLISADGRSLSFLIFLRDEISPGRKVSGEELKRRRQEMVDDLRKLRAEWTKPGVEPVRISGFPVILANLIEHVQRDLRVFTIASAALFLLALAVIYKKVAFVLGPLLTAAVPVICIVGFMAASGMTMTVITSNLPLLLFVLMLPYTIYIIERFRERRSARAASGESIPDSLTKSLRAVFPPCLFSCITTVARIRRAYPESHSAVNTFGMMMAIGMAVGLCIVMLFLPCFFRLFGENAGTAPKAGDAAWMQKLVGLFAAACLRFRWGVLATSLVVLVVCVVGALRISVEQKFTHYFWESSEVYQGLEYIDQRLGGLMPLEVVLRSDDPRVLHERRGTRRDPVCRTLLRTARRHGEYLFAEIRPRRGEQGVSHDGNESDRRSCSNRLADVPPAVT